MRLLALLLLALGLAHAARAGEVLDRVRQNDVVRCAAPPEQLGFAMPEGRTGYSGFDVDFCRAVAAAALGDASKMQFFALPAAPRAAALKDGTIDVVARDTPITLTRLLDPELLPVGASFSTGLGFMIRAQANILTIEGLDGASFCLRRDPEVARVFGTQMNVRNFKFRLIESDSYAEAVRGFYANKCDALLGNVPDLATARSRTDSPAFWRIGLTLFTLESYGPTVLRSDPQWAAIVRYTLTALVAAENNNVSQRNLKEALTSRDRAVQRLLGREADPGAPLGLPATWVEKVVGAVGNYGEMYDRNLGVGTPLGLARWPNDMWFRGGVLTAPAFP